eukprot:m.127457 g.127457  ORF g.127457 m.127457 type:complete len:62 (-) comp23545_c0_seq1:332-517(-)
MFYSSSKGSTGNVTSMGNFLSLFEAGESDSKNAVGGVEKHLCRNPHGLQCPGQRELGLVGN